MTGWVGSNQALLAARGCNWSRLGDYPFSLWRSVLPLRQLLAVVVFDDARHVGVGLAIGRHASVLLHALRPGIVSGEGLDHIVVVEQQQFAQITDAAVNVLRRIETVSHAQLAGRGRHELH